MWQSSGLADLYPVVIIFLEFANIYEVMFLFRDTAVKIDVVLWEAFKEIFKHGESSSG